MALLDLGLTEAREVSTLSKVPTSKIYHILEQLHEKGLVIILPEFPKKYAPIPFNEYLDKLQRDHEEAARAIDRDRGDLAEMFSVQGDVEIGDRGSFTVVRGRRNALDKIVELIGGASRDLYLLGSRGIAIRSEFLLDDLGRARARGVRLRFAIPIVKESLDALSALSHVGEVRARDVDDAPHGSNVAIVIADGSRALLVHFVPDDGHLYQGKDAGFFTDHEAMVAALQAVSEPYWTRAAHFETRRREIEEGRRPEFTRFHGTQGEAYAATKDAVAKGVREVRYVNSLTTGSLPSMGRELVTAILEEGARVRALVNVRDPVAAEGLLAIMESHPHAEFRHYDPAVHSRFWLIDEREAFFAATSPRTVAAFDEGVDPDTTPDLIVHTTNAQTVRSLDVNFEEFWTSGQPLRARRHDLREGGVRALSPTRFFDADARAMDGALAVADAARREVRILADAETLERVVDADWEPPTERGVAVRMIASVSPETRTAALLAAERAEVRHVAALGLLGISSDNSEAFVVMPRGGRGSSAPRVAVRSSDPMYVDGFDGFFDGIWAVATPLEERLRELDDAGHLGVSMRITPGAGPPGDP